jgi:site-specific recombinase XerD
MQLTQAIAEFLNGYFSTHERSKKTRTAYSSDLGQFRTFAGQEFDITSLGGTLVEDWVGHLRKEGYAPASMRRKTVVLKVFCSSWVRRGVLNESPFWRVKLSLGRIEQLPQIRHRAGDLLKKVLGPAILIQIHCLGQGSHLNNDSYIGIRQADIYA